RMRNPATIQDLLDANAKPTETTVEGKKVYEANQMAYLIDGNRVVITSTLTMHRVLKRNGKPRFSEAMEQAVKQVDFGRAETMVTDLSGEMHQVRDFMAALGQEMPLATVQDFDYQMPMNTTTKYICRDERAGE